VQKRGWRAQTIALTAESRDAVRAFHRAAVDRGATSLHEPRLWPAYHPNYYGSNYYGAFVRDPDGNNLEAVCHDGEDPSFSSG
jgi:predicted lactoylglutathione lyase